ncbi:MAG: alpha/beta fold hydrolase [Saprospiraceae bacterium]|nr:alpha/beta fold hydrolase [Saprospiraceae bacterium]
MRPFLMLLFGSIFSLPLLAQSDIVGQWKGDIQVPGGKLGVIVFLETGPEGLSCKMDVPMQRAKGIVAEKTSFSENSLDIQFGSLAANYTGALQKSGIIKGTWTQNGMSFPLDLERFTGETTLERPQHPKPPYPYQIEEIKVQVGEPETHSIAGTLTIPEGEGPFPTAVMVSGSGPQDRDETLLGHKPFWVIADYLSRNGIAVFRYDDRSVGESTGDFASATTLDFKEDAIAVLREIAKHEKTDQSQIGIIGHSEGGLISALAASRHNEVKFIVMLAGPGVTGHEILKRQIRDISLAEGIDKKTLKKASNLNAEVIDLARAEGDMDEQKQKAKEKFRHHYETVLTDEERAEAGDFDLLFQTRIQPLFTPWMKTFLNLDPRKYIERISCPVLALIGGKDTQVSPQVNIPALTAALDAAPTTEWTVRELPDLNHLFQKSRTGAPSEYGEKIETFNQEVLVLIRNWIKDLPPN